MPSCCHWRLHKVRRSASTQCQCCISASSCLKGIANSLCPFSADSSSSAQVKGAPKQQRASCAAPKLPRRLLCPQRGTAEGQGSSYSARAAAAAAGYGVERGRRCNMPKLRAWLLTLPGSCRCRRRGWARALPPPTRAWPARLRGARQPARCADAAGNFQKRWRQCTINHKPAITALQPAR